MTILSPGFVSAKMVSTIASVEPMVTTMFVSGSMGMPMNLPHLRLTARRKFGAPIVIGYWCGPSWLTSRSRSVMAFGGSKSGKPCAKLIAPQSRLTRVIRRMTESVKCWFRLLISCILHTFFDKIEFGCTLALSAAKVNARCVGI